MVHVQSVQCAKTFNVDLLRLFFLVCLFIFKMTIVKIHDISVALL